MAAHILLVDDDVIDLDIYRHRLKHEGYGVTCVASGSACLLALRDRLPDLIILDLTMPGMTGLEVCKKIREDIRVAKVAILMFTNLYKSEVERQGLEIGADDYLPKTVDRSIFLLKVKNLIEIGRNRGLPRDCTISIDIDKTMSFQLSGAVSLPNKPCEEFHFDRAKLNYEMARVAGITYKYHTLWIQSRRGSAEAADFLSERSAWRNLANDRMVELSAEFRKCDALMTAWGRAQEKVGEALDILTIRFSGPPQNLALPFELMPINNRLPIALCHPTSRQIIDKVTNDTYTLKLGWRAFLESQRGKVVRVLLIAGDDIMLNEINNVAEELKKIEVAAGLKIEIDPPDLSRSLTRDEAEGWLNRKQHHIIHFAGHGEFDRAYPANSSLNFEDGKINARLLNTLLSRSFTQLLYLSCCSGAEIADQNPDKESASQFLGLFDAAAQAGTPAIFGYRWPVVEREARVLATEFYRYLGKSPYSLEHAALHARRYIYDHSETGDHNDAWFSPLLLIQNPD